MNATVERFLQYLRYERNLSWRTVVTYRGNLVQWEEYMTVAGRPLDVISVTAADIRQWLVSRSAQGDGPATLRLKLQALRSLYRYLLRCGEVAVNPAAQVELAKLPKPLPKFVRDKTVDAVLDADLDQDDFAQVRDRLVVMLFYETGIRLSELIGLQDVAVDVDKRELKVRGASKRGLPLTGFAGSAFQRAKKSFKVTMALSRSISPESANTTRPFAKAPCDKRFVGVRFPQARARNIVHLVPERGKDFCRGVKALFVRRHKIRLDNLELLLIEGRLQNHLLRQIEHRREILGKAVHAETRDPRTHRGR